MAKPPGWLSEALKGKLPNIIQVDKRAMMELLISNKLLTGDVIRYKKITDEEFTEKHTTEVKQIVSQMSDAHIDIFIMGVCKLTEK